MLLNSMKCDFQGQEEGEAGKFWVNLFFPGSVYQPSLLWTCHGHLCPPGTGTAVRVSFFCQIPASAWCFPAKEKSFKEASLINLEKAFSFPPVPYLFHLCCYLMFISLAAFTAFEFGQNNLLCNWANEFQPTLHLPITAQQAANLFPVYPLSPFRLLI